MSLMLASVLSRAEAEIALAGDADIIDCKDPARGALGALPLSEIEAIANVVNGRRLVSAVVETPPDLAQARAAIEAVAPLVDIVKFAAPSGPEAQAFAKALAPLCVKARLVAVLFGDEAPDLAALDHFARAGFAGVMLDTAQKGAGRLIDHVSPAALAAFIAQCRALDLRSGLAGSLEAPDVPRLLPLKPDVIGFRGALCAGHDRRAGVEPHAVKLIRDLIPHEAPAHKYGEQDGLDCVFVRDLIMPVEIGAYGHERGRVQRVRFTVEADVTRAVGPDDMRAVFSYDVIIDAIKMILAAGHIELVETLAERLAESVLGHHRVRALTVIVEKLDVLPGSVGIRIRRERAPVAHDFGEVAQASSFAASHAKATL